MHLHTIEKEMKSYEQVMNNGDDDDKTMIVISSLHRFFAKSENKIYNYLLIIFISKHITAWLSNNKKIFKKT